MKCHFLIGLSLLAIMTGCMKWEHGEGVEAFDAPAGVLIGCEGNFQYGNATLSFYNPTDNEVDNEVFVKANGMKLGDVAQSITPDADGEKVWIIVNNSHVAFAIDARTFREKGRISGLPSPRYMHIVNNRKAYITQLWSNTIVVVDPSTYRVTGTIEIPGMESATGSTERIVGLGEYVYVTCWSYQNRLLKINTANDNIEAELRVGKQPKSIVSDYQGRLWILCDGAYPGESGEARLQCVDPAKMEIVADYPFGRQATPTSLCIDPSGRQLYWLDGDVWEMSVDETTLPVVSLVASRGTLYYSLWVNPVGGDLYLADAIDYQQPGVVYRYTAEGELVDEFYTGVNPSSFGWTGR